MQTRWFCSAIITFVLSFSAFAAEQGRVQITGLRGLINLRIDFDDKDPIKDVVSLSTDSGQKWKVVHTGPIDLLRLRPNQAIIHGKLPDRVRVEEKPANDLSSPTVMELDVASGPFLFMFHEYFSNYFVKFPRTDGIIEKVAARELWDEHGRRTDMYLFSIKTSTRASTWLVRQGTEWRASIIKFMYETFHQFYETGNSLKNGRHNHMKTIHINGYDDFELDTSLKDLWSNFDPSSRYPAKGGFARLFLNQLRESLEKVVEPHLVNQVELRLRSIEALKKIVREIESDIRHYDQEAKERMVHRIMTSFETRFLYRLHDAQEVIVAEREIRVLQAATATRSYLKPAQSLEDLLLELSKDLPVRCSLLF